MLDLSDLRQSLPLTWTLIILTASGSLLLRNYYDERRANPRNLPLPPGPKPRPIIGNALDMPREYEWLTYSDWAKQYGEIVHAKVLNKHVIILNTLEAVNEIFEKRSANYSDRPRMPMVKELMGWTWSLTQMNYGPWWRKHRKAFHQYFYPAASAKYRPMQTMDARRLLKKLLEEPEDFLLIVRHALSSTILRTVYGIEIHDTNDPFVVNAQKVVGSLADAGIPGAFLVDTLPFLKYVPSWIPGASFKRKAKEWRALLPDFVDKPFEDVKSALERGNAVPCMTVDLLERLRSAEDPEDEEIVARNVTAIAYAGGADTTVSTVQAFFMTMALHPEAQRKAQAQLDEVIGSERLPDYEDIDSLPYVQAVLKELLRWQPVTPLAVVHSASVNDEYKNYFIPKDSLMLGNAWLILHDEKAYPDAMSFRPERFLRSDGSLNTDVQDPMLVAFGFGRRICPGRHMAVNGALITIASVLAAFNIEPEVDENGEPLLKEARMTSGMLSYPIPFKCKITPRSNRVAKLVSESLDTSGKH